MRLEAWLIAGALVGASAPGFAHHSFAMFDREKALTLTGTVKEYEWANPHVWIHLVAPDASGKPVAWGFEMQSVQQDAAAGWRPDSVKPGDTVTIEYHPLKDGSRGGQLMGATLADGRHLGPPASARVVFRAAREAAERAKSNGEDPQNAIGR
jgi:Family of unknown function (DUF6152)